MLFNAFISLALAAVASASPLAEAASSNPCDGGRNYCGWMDKSKNVPPTCKCFNGQKWNASKHKCEFPPHPKPSCPPTQKPICAKSSKEWCDYDASNPLCEEDGTTVVVVVEVEVTVTEQAPEIDEECAKPKCPKGQTWDATDKKCRFPCFDEPTAKTCKSKGNKPICAKDPNNFCDFDAKASYCEDNGVNTFQCIDKSKSTTTVLVGVYATVDVAVKALGFDCLCNGIGCLLTATVWTILSPVDLIGGIICGLLGC